MIFLAEIESMGEPIYSEKTNKKKRKKVNTKKKGNKMIKLANKLAGFSRFSQGEIELIKSYAYTVQSSKVEESKVEKVKDGHQKRINYKRQVKQEVYIMVNANDIKNGMTIIFEDALYIVLEFSHVKPGKGAAFVKAKLRNLRTGSIVEKTFNSSIKLEKAMITRQNMQYLYNTGDAYAFMNMETYEQIELTKDQIGDDAKFLKEGINVDITFYEGEMLGISLPDKIEYVITHTEPAVKGNTTNNALKDAELENGLKVRVPLFIQEGEAILVTTSDGKYDSRA